MNRAIFFLATVFLMCCSVANAQDIEPPVQENDTAEYASQSGSFLPINQPDRVVVRKLPPDKLQALKASDDYWYANREPVKKEVRKPSGSFFNTDAFESLLWIVILCSFTGIVIWYLASGNARLFRRQAKPILNEEDDTSIGDDIFSIAYEREIGRAEAAADYRTAVRLYYLQTLKVLSERNLISYRTDRTDSDYVAALYSTCHYKSFSRLTRLFEYTWYGGFPLSQKTYEALRTDFQNMLNGVAA